MSEEGAAAGERGRRALRRLSWALTLFAFAPALAVALIANRLDGDACPATSDACRPVAEALVQAVGIATPIAGWPQLAAAGLLFLGTLAASHFGRPGLLARIIAGWLIAFAYGGLLPLGAVFATESLLPRLCPGSGFGTCPAWGLDIAPTVQMVELSGWSLLVVGPVAGGVFLLYLIAVCAAALVREVRREGG